EVGTSNFEYPMGSVGSALNGVNMYNPCASPPDAIEDEAYSFDYYSGHPAGPTGIYHYHTTSKGPLEVLEYKGIIETPTVGSGEIEVFGIMCDGVVVMGCTELDGSVPNTSDWDAQNGHVHDMVDELGTTQFTNRYHTHVCYDEITEDDTDGNGYQEHEFTPEISYYKTEGMGQNYNRCAAMSDPIEEDMVALGDEITPGDFSLYQNYPNPFNPTTSIEYDLTKSGSVDLAIYDLMGHRVRTLVFGNQKSGFKTVVWDATNDFGQAVSAGMYFYTLNTSEGSLTQKMLLIK
ncbi:MAG: T9SS type A sorting domain-containing protein, partial [Candidatus Marinimicrobia bacterium]|nr:T9SS type A sorting domain-containing protein [Candidatus Neomarinimicrobiota bacterium]